MNVRIFWVRAMKCMYAQTRPRFILSSQGVFGGMEFEPMFTPREKSPLSENVPRGGSNPRRRGQRAQALPTELFRPPPISSKAMHRVCCFRWHRHVTSWTADVWSDLVSLISCILPSLLRFRAVPCYRPLCLQTRHMWRWLTSVQLRMQSWCSLV